VILLLSAVLAAAVATVALRGGKAEPASAPSEASSAAPSASAPTDGPGSTAGEDTGATPVVPVSTEPTGPTTQPADAPQLTTAVVGLAYADWNDAELRVEAAGFVAGVVESGGTCTLQLVRDGATVTGTSTAEADATTTNCGLLAIPGDQLQAGEWQATLSYESQTAHGASRPLPIVVPAR
jgi:hypothetical protein